MRFNNYYLNPNWFYTPEQYDPELTLVADFEQLRTIIGDENLNNVWFDFLARTWKNWTSEAWGNV